VIYTAYFAAYGLRLACHRLKLQSGRWSQNRSQRNPDYGPESSFPPRVLLLWAMYSTDCAILCTIC